MISSYQVPTITSGVRDDSMIVRTFNRRRPIIKPTLNDDEYHALMETESLYAPSAFIRLLTTYFRPVSGAGLHVGHGQYFDFDHISSKLLGVAGLNSSYTSQVYGGGKGLDLHDMYVSSMGEGIERVLGSFAFLSWADRLQNGTRREMEDRGMHCLGPEDLPIFSEAQFSDPHFGFDRWDDNTTMGWIPGTRLYSGETIWVPAQLVLFIYYRPDDEPLIGLAPSGGLASHITTDLAVYHALDELVERDAVNLRWHARVPLDRIVMDVEPRDAKVRRQLSELDRGIGKPEFHLQNLDFFEFPVLTAIEFDNWLKDLRYNAGGGVGASPDAAMRSALGEYCQSERSLRICQLADNWQFEIAFKRLFGIHADAKPYEFDRFVQAITFYGYQRNQKKADWYFNGGGEVKLSELYARCDAAEPDPVKRIHLAMQSRGIDPIMFDFTPRAFAQTKVWKAFIPELSQPYPPQSPALGHPRYLKCPVDAGYRDHPIDQADLLQDPLPYP